MEIDKSGRMLTGLWFPLISFFTFFVQRDDISIFKNFRKCRQFYGIVKAITEKYCCFLLKHLSEYQSFVMLYLHLALKPLFQFVSELQ